VINWDKTLENKTFKNTPWMLALAISFIIALTTFTFLPVLDNELINFDNYVSENHHIQTGLTLEGVVWAFTTFTDALWHPLTWLS
jgi:hypothetical protein